MIRYLAATLVFGVVAACASGGAGAAPMSDSTATAPATIRRSPDLITADEMAKVSVRDAYDAVQTLRPVWLRGRGPTTITGTPSEVAVYMNGQRIGGPSALRQFSVSSIKEIRYLSPSDATNRYGTGHEAGAILVTGK